MLVKKAYNIRLYPNKDQANFINKTIGGCKFAYNLCLKSKQDLWKYYHTDYDPKMALLVQEYKELANIDSQGLANTYMDLKKAYPNWWNSLKGRTTQKKGRTTQKKGRTTQKSNVPKFKNLKVHNGS